MLKTSIVKWDGTQVDLVRADDPAGFALKVLSLGLLGVTVGEEPEQTRDGLWSLRTASGKTTVLQTIDAPAWRWCTNLSLIHI